MEESATETLRVVIVDDEPHARKKLRTFLRRAAGTEIVAECANGVEAIQAIQATDPDVVFLDVQMPEAGGFEVLNAVGPERMPLTVFVTAYDAFAVKAFEAEALDYLLKPFDEDRFNAALERARRARSQRVSVGLKQLQALLRSVHGDQRYTPRLLVKSGAQYVFVKVEDIEWIKAADNYLELRVGAQVHLLRETIAGMGQRLDPAQFVRIHRSLIVNLDRVKAIRPFSGSEYEVLLASGTRFLSGRRYRENLRALMR